MLPEEKERLTREGFIEVETNAYPLWKLYRGEWINRIITDVCVASNNLSLWVKLSKENENVSIQIPIEKSHT